MSRSERLLDLLQILRRHRLPVAGSALATELGVSLRTLYRDIDGLCAQGAAIEGEAGVGYVLRPGFLLPPLMFSEDEIEALVLGSRWVAGRGDAGLAAAAGNALAKIAAVLPDALRDGVDQTALFVPGGGAVGSAVDLADVRQAVRRERKVVLAYRDEGGRASERVVWPIAVGFFDTVRIVAAWCELRADFRHFRADRIEAMTVTETRYPRRRAALLRAWRERVRIPRLAADGN